MIELIKGMPENVIAVRMSGKVTGDDYYKVLVPAIEGKVKKHEKVRLLYQIDTDIKITLDAMFDDLKLGVYNYNSFEKFALVSDAGWMTDAVKLFKHIIPGIVKNYSNEELPEAKAWISE